MLRLWILVTFAIAACHPKSGVDPIIDPGVPPLPPSSGTAIGILLDDATELALRSDQVDKLRAIDNDLAAREDQLTAHERPAPSPDPQSPGPQHRGGGRHRGGGGGLGGGGAGRHQAAQAAATGDPGKAKQERSATERDAISRALEVLDPKQRETARKLLDQHGFTTGAPTPAPSPSTEPEDPDDDADPAPQP